jgi:hypothetical protein
MQFEIFDAELHTVYNVTLSPEVAVTKKILTKVYDFFHRLVSSHKHGSFSDFLVPMGVPMDFYPTPETGWTEFVYLSIPLFIFFLTFI